MKALHQHILQIMSTQSEGYLISPNAASFMAAGLDDPEEILQALLKMEDKEVEYIKIETDFERVENEETVEWTQITDEGWQLTTKGREVVSA